MEIRKVMALRGPNIWTRFPVLEVWIDLQELEESPSDKLPGFNERLMAWLPSMIEHRCSIGERGGFFERLRRGTWMGHILEHTTIELQVLAGTIVGFGKARETEEAGVYKVVIEYEEEELGRAALATAFRLLQAAIHDLPFDVAAEVQKLHELADDICLGPSTAAIANAAVARNIPMRRLNSQSLILFGQGARQRRIWTAETDRTGAIAESIAQDKQLTKTLLKAAGVPVPEGRVVDSAADAWAAACELETSVAVKPRDSNHGRGVFTGLTTQEQVMTAYETALDYARGGEVLVERFIPGTEHRLLVVGGKLIAACRGDILFVTANGRQSIRDLVEEQLNQDPRRGMDEACLWYRVEFNTVVRTTLEQQGYTPDSIPGAGVRVLLQRYGNLSVDVTDEVHPEVADRAILAAQMVGLDVAGIDMVIGDVSRPMEEQSAAIVEVNAGPGLLMHVKPQTGTPRPVGEAIIETLFPQGSNGRIPLVAVTGTNGKTMVTRVISRILERAGHCVGMACSDGIFVGKRRIESGDCSGPRSARSVLLNPRVDAAVLETGRGGILREGLGFDLCDVAVVTNIGAGDHLGGFWIETPEKMAWVKATPVDVVAKEGYAVLNADDPLVPGMMECCRASALFYAKSEDNPVIVEHRKSGGRAAFLRNGTIVLATDAEETSLMPIAEIPFTSGGRIAFQVENALAAAAAAWALGLPLNTISGVLREFHCDAEHVPGVMNVFQMRGATVIVDKPQNTSALDSLIAALELFPHERRSIVYSSEGDRRDQALVAQGELLGQAFDRVIVYESSWTDGRAEGEITTLFRQGLAAGTRTTEVLEINQSHRAVETALGLLQAGDLLVVQPDDIEETLEIVKRFASGNEGVESNTVASMDGQV